MKNARKDTAWFKAQLLERFVRYTGIFTTSDRLSTTKPSTPGQWDLLRLLEKELNDLGFRTFVDPNGYVVGKLEASASAKNAPSVCLISHVDTAPDAPGQNVRAIVHENYDGKPIVLNAEQTIDPAENPLLTKYVSDTIVTSDGTTLLGADDKAGVAELMTAAAYLAAHPEHPHGPVEIVFTTDEEVGRGTENFPFDQLQSKIAYTFDGNEEGGIESECYNAYAARVVFTGKSYHPGSARGKLVNSVSMAAAYLSMIPRSESPEATDGRYGCLWANDIQGGIERTSVDIYIRDFDAEEVRRRIDSLSAYARAVEAAFPGGKVEVSVEAQYLNMKRKLDEVPQLVAVAERAMRNLGIEPFQQAIRGGTDGARLTEMGLPTPNIFTGGMNYHSRQEWVALGAMVNATLVALELIELWSQETL